jgi:DNA-binding MarR family transcriptional regulator
VVVVVGAAVVGVAVVGVAVVGGSDVVVCAAVEVADPLSEQAAAMTATASRMVTWRLRMGQIVSYRIKTMSNNKDVPETMEAPGDVLSVFWDVGVVSRLTEAVVERALDGIDLTPRQFALLSMVLSQGPLTPGEAAERSGIPAPSVSRLLAGFEQRGLVSETAHPTDGRSRIVSITAAGRSLVADCQAGFGRMHRGVYDLLGVEAADVVWSLRRLEWALRRLADLPEMDTAGARSRTPNWIRYSGPALTPAEEAEAVAHLEWMIFRRGRF